MLYEVITATVQLFGTLLPKFGIETTFVPLTKIEAWRQAVRPRNNFV